ncbi:MAG: hypothetical protein ACYDA1_07265 [Vulcanimicrobiaceae bacterium]
MTSKLFLVATFLLLALVTQATIAQQTTPDARETKINSVINGLNSLDPATRIATFEEAMASSDSTLRRVALSTAFASSDADLRSIALDKAIASVTTFVVQIDGTGPSSCAQPVLRSCKGPFQNGLGSEFEVRMTNFNSSRGTFDAVSSFSGRKETAASLVAASRDSYPAPPIEYEPISHQGSVAGGRLSFEVDASGLGDWPDTDSNTRAHCSGVARLEGGNAILKGSMTCNARDTLGFHDTENFSIEINVLG